jgi:hypothetical protein
MKLDTAEPRRRRLKRERTAWPKWLRSRHLVRWLFILGPLVYRILRTVRMLFSTDDG